MASDEGASKAKDDGSNSGAAQSPAPLTKEHLSQHDSASGIPSDAGRERAKRAANSPMRSPMISEMKRINALNLEPASNAKASASRNASSNAQGSDLKMEFQRSAAEIRLRQDQNSRAKQEKEAGKAREAAGDADGKRGGADNSRNNDAKVANKSFNPGAAAFNPGAAAFNPGAAAFTPGGAAPVAPVAAPPAPKQAPPQAQASPKTPSSSPSFSTYATATPELQSRSLERILDLCFVQCDGERLERQAPDWPEAKGASYQDVLGQPRNSGPMPHMQQMQGGAMPGPWQQQGQQFGMAQVPGGQAPMGYPQMCPQMQQMMQRPQNAGGAQQPQMMQGGQGMMAFQPQMMQGGQGMMPGMNPAQFGGQGGQAMMVPMMMPAGQHPGQPGPQGGGPQQGQMMQQMYRQQMGPGGPQSNDRS